MGLQWQLGLSADRKQSAEDARRDVLAARAARSSSEEMAKAQAAARKTADEALWREASAAVFGTGGGPSSSKPLDMTLIASRREAKQVTNQELNTATAGFSGRFHVAAGGFGNVFRVPSLPSLPGAGAVAIKQQLPNSGEDPKKEVELLGKCRHPNVLPLLGYSLGTASCLACLIYPLMTGGTLEDRLLLNPPAWERLQKLGHTSLPAPLSWHLRLRILRDTMRALVYLHTPTSTKPRTLHCDVKPSNVLLDAQLNAYLADFGMSKMSSGSCAPNPSAAAENVPPQRVAVSTGGGGASHRHLAAAAASAAAPHSPARNQLRGPPLTMPSPITAETCRTLTASFLGDGLSVYDDTDESPSLTASPARVPSPSIGEPSSASRRASAPTSLVASPLRPATHPPPPPLAGGDGARRVVLSLPPAHAQPGSSGPELHGLPVYDDVDEHPYQAAISREPSRQQSSEASPLAQRRPSNERRPSTEGLRRRGEALNRIAQFDSARDEDDDAPPPPGAGRERHHHHHHHAERERRPSDGDGVPVYDDVPDSHAPFVSSPKPTPPPRPPPPRREREEQARRPSGIGEVLARDWERAKRERQVVVEEEDDEDVSPGARIGPGGFGVTSTARQQLIFGLPGTAFADESPPDDEDDEEEEAQPRRPGKPSTRGTQWFIDPLYIDGTEDRALAVPRSDQQCHTSELTDGYAMGMTILVTLTAQPPADLIRICEEMLKQPTNREAWAAPGVSDRSAGCWPAKVEHGLAGLVRGLSWVPLEEERTPLPEALRQLEALASTAGVDGADDF